jgi:hypothetical protein
VPLYYRELVASCLNPRPEKRVSASEVLRRFPTVDEAASRPIPEPRETHYDASEKRYIDPSAAVEREDIARFGNVEYVNEDTLDNATSGATSEPFYNIENRSSKSSILAMDTNSTLAYTGIDVPDHAFVPRSDSMGGYREDEDDLDAEVIPVSPSDRDDKRWQEINYEGHGCLVHKDSVDTPGPGGETEPCGCETIGNDSKRESLNTSVISTPTKHMSLSSSPPAVQISAVGTTAMEVPTVEAPAMNTPAVETPAMEIPAVESSVERANLPTGDST